MQAGEAAHRLEIAEKHLEELTKRVEELERRPVYVPHPGSPPTQIDPNPFPPGFPGATPTWFGGPPQISCVSGIPQNTTASGAPLS